MIIKSKFKDYYDYLRHVYGVDDKITYVREEFDPIVIENSHHHYSNIYAISTNHQHFNLDTDYDLKFVAVCGKLYAIAKKRLSLNNGPDIKSAPFPQNNEWFYVKPESYLNIVHKETSAASAAVRVKKCHGFEHPDVIKLHKEVGQPVFTFDAYRYKIKIDGRIPNLGELGIPAVEDANQIYQNIGHYLTNVLKGGPDISPSAPMTSKEKIVSHGFDLKQSFRHRL